VTSNFQRHDTIKPVKRVLLHRFYLTAKASIASHSSENTTSYFFTVTATHLAAVMSKAVPALQALHDLSEPASVISASHLTHFPAFASQARAALQAVAEVKSALAVVAPMPNASANMTAANRYSLILVTSDDFSYVLSAVQSPSEPHQLSQNPLGFDTARLRHYQQWR
jgi:hypothetical protein